MKLPSVTLAQLLFSLILATSVHAQENKDNADCKDFSSDSCMVKATWAALTTWADNWSNKDYQAYINSYSATAAPKAGLTRAQWLAGRKKALSAGTKIKISLHMIDAQFITETTARATVIQRYTAQHYSDIVLKTFHLGLEQGQVKILSENVDRSLEPIEADAIINEFGY